MSKKQKIRIDVTKVVDILDTEPDISLKEKQAIVERLLASSDELPKWLVNVLKIIAYAIGIILAGYGTNAAAQILLNL